MSAFKHFLRRRVLFPLFILALAGVLASFAWLFYCIFAGPRFPDPLWTFFGSVAFAVCVGKLDEWTLTV